MSRIAAGLVLGCAALGMVAYGCSMPRSFPSASGSQGLSADSPPLPQVITQAMNYAHKAIAPKTAMVFNLPVETNAAAWTTYERMLEPAKPMCPGDAKVWTVRQARIDGSVAQVDIECPTRDGFYQLITVHMKDASAGIGYKPEYIQYWRIPVKDPVCNTPADVVARNCKGKTPIETPDATVAPSAGAGKPPVSGAKTEEPNK